jgi:NAD(P)H-hydrate epimerase
MTHPGRERRTARVRDVHGHALVPLVTAAEAAELDRAAREHAGIPERVLMETAGRSAALIIDRLYPRGRVVAMAGAGHNGGDALVAARVLRAWGREVSVVAVGNHLPDAPLLHGLSLDIEPPEAAAGWLARADVLIDGILGTGLRGPVRASAAEAIEAINSSTRPVVSLDLPSGLDGNTGRVNGAVIRADVTITFGWPKIGMLFQPARSVCGRLIVVEIGFPPYEKASALALTPGWAALRLPRRAPDAHKGSVGRLLVLAGREGMGGAVSLTAHAAQRAGAGLVRVASAAANRSIVQTLVPEATFVDRATLSDADLEGINALVAGPGIGTDDEGQAVLERALVGTGTKPVLLDAGALTNFARAPDALRDLARSRPVVLTPHAGELERLSGQAAADIAADPVAAARAAAEAFGCVVLLKGQPSVIAAPQSALLVNTVGSSDTASAGMGDTLAGIIGAFLAAGVPARDAAALGLFYGSRAADLAGRGRSLSPRDVADALPRAFERAGAAHSSLRLPFVTFDQPARW